MRLAHHSIMEGIMKNEHEKMQNAAGAALVAAALLLVNAAFAQGALAAEPQKADQSYTWSAEIVSFNAASRMLTLKSHIDSATDIKLLDDLMEGEPITLTWTGLTWGAGIRDITRGHQSSAPADALILPAEFVGTELNDNYVIYRLPIPSASVGKIQALKPGDWVTATSPRHASDPNQAVLEIRGYNDID
jgi:hypothetical protein